MECLVIYGYRIKPERIAEFEATYSVTGAWADLLRTVPGYSARGCYGGATATTPPSTDGRSVPPMITSGACAPTTISTNNVPP